MIDRKTLAEIAKLNGLKPWQQEKHYIQSLVLTILAEQPLVFKGGTYLWFFHGLRRFSEDLDFTASEKIPTGLPETVSRNLELYGVENKSKTITDNEKTLSFRLSAKGPLNTGAIDECRVYVEISRREPVLKKPMPLRFEYPAYQLPVKRIAGMSLEEVGAEKVRAIMAREKARDIYDLHFLIKNKKIAFNEEITNKKLEYYGTVFSEKKFLREVKNSQKHYSKELKNIALDELPDFQEVEKTLKNWLKKQP